MHGVFDLVRHAELAVEERFPLVSFVYTRAQDVHQVGVAQVDFVGLVEVLVTLGLRGEQTQNLRFVECV